ncbi:hypothetical protein STRAU_0906 [Streptomyces aurantiacus JA 4570]|uniref:Uncharacterized protein n=1 Tax=Streptomyces aurantiacus JA 4570 TaxID=1286094 RepID=S4A5L1_9ACTN|nr:hypothetical protein STRAU_0906 [Streptomyces aurantiacus JA 4570]
MGPQESYEHARLSAESWAGGGVGEVAHHPPPPHPCPCNRFTMTGSKNSPGQETDPAERRNVRPGTPRLRWNLGRNPEVQTAPRGSDGTPRFRRSESR